MHLTFLYVIPDLVIPAPYRVRGELQRGDRREAERAEASEHIQPKNTGFRFKPGLTDKGKSS